MAPVAASWAEAIGDNTDTAKDRIKIQSEVRDIDVPPVVGMRLGGVTPARGPEASGWGNQILL
jgi:hypothetical protein